MEEMTQEEFTDRAQAIQRAMRIFSHMTDKDITKAFMAYQMIFAERERAIFLSAQTFSKFTRSGSPFDKYERPKCPDCDSDMKIRNVPENSEGIKTQLVCSNDSCDTVLDSEMTMQEWMNVLKVKRVEGEKG